MLARGRCPRRRSPHRKPAPGARGEASPSASASPSSGWPHTQQHLIPHSWRRLRLQRRQPWSWKSTLVVVAVAALLAASVAEAGAAGGSRGGRSSSSRGAVPWWYPSRDWGMLPSDNDGGGGGRGGWGGGGGGGWFGLRGVRFREEARLAGEFVETWLADGLAEREEEEGEGAAAMMPVCHVHEGGNHTLRRLGASVDRCASPYFSLPEIHPNQLVYTEVDPAAEAAAKKKKEQAAAAAAAAAARARRKRKKREARGASGGAARGDADDGLLVRDEDLDDAAGREGEEEEEEEDTFLGIFLFLKGDFFSVELENALTAVMPAYPRAWVVKADAPAFLSFCVQYDLHSFPQLLLFRNGHLMSRYRGRRTPEGLAAWFSLMMGNLPKAVPRRPLPPPPPPHPLSPPGLDEPLTWAALLYAATKIVTALRWLVKRRRRIRGGSGAGGGGRSFFRVSAAVTRVRRWLVRVLFRSRGGGGGGGGAPQRVREGAGGTAGGEGGAPDRRGGGSAVAVIAGNS